MMHRVTSAMPRGASRMLRPVSSISGKKTFLKPIKTKQDGADILHDPLWNKGMAMDYNERDRLHLRGLLPPRIKTLEEQSARVMNHIRSEGDDDKAAIRKNLYLQDLHNRNETLYHRVLVDNVEELAPLIYTPTVGHVCQQFGDQYRRSRGMYFSREDRGLFSSMWAARHPAARHPAARPPRSTAPRSPAPRSTAWAPWPGAPLRSSLSTAPSTPPERSAAPCAQVLQLEPRRRARDRGDRWLAHPRAGRSGRARHGHPDRQAGAVLRVRGHRAAPRATHHSRLRHRQ